MNAIQQLITEHMDIWTAADTGKRSGRGRALSNAGSVYGVKKLRELILELAVRGKLVPQDASDEPASELLKRIQAEKAKSHPKTRSRKSTTNTPPPFEKGGLGGISDNEKPFELPLSWEWARLECFVLSISSGGTPSKINSQFWNGNIPWASVKDLNVEKYLETTQDFITKEGLIAGSKLANKGDVIICTRMGLGKIAIAAIDVAINQDLKALKVTALLNVDYFINFYSTLKIIGSGMTVAGIRQDELLDYLVPTPPLAEQHRIVAKVDELMALCDQLEAHHSNAAEAHEKLVNHLLGTLTQSQSADDFSDNWQRIAAHFDTLFTTEASIEALKQTLLQLAVMGKLVPQDTNDEPASELLKRIQAEKAKLVAEGKIKKIPLNPPLTKGETLTSPHLSIPPFAKGGLGGISNNEKPFELPRGWEWTRLNNAIDVRDGTHESPKETLGENTYPLVTSKDFQDGAINFYSARRISEADHLEISRRSLVEKYDILFSMIGGNIGNQVMVTEDRPFSVKNVALFKYYDKELTVPAFIKKYTENLAFTLQSTAVGGAQPFVALGALRNLVLALPPRAEQHRIVAKVDALMAICDQLKTRIQQANQQQQAIANVLVAQAVA